MKIQSTAVVNKPKFQSKVSNQESADSSAKDRFLPGAAAAVGGVAGGYLGYHVGGTVGSYLGLVLTPEGAGLGDLLINAARGGMAGAVLGTAVYGTAAAVGVYLLCQSLAES